MSTTPSLIVKQLDTFPAWVLQLNDDNGWIDLSAANSIKFAGKQVSGGAAVIGPDTAVAATTNAFTCDTTPGSNILTTVSSFTGIDEGCTVTVPFLTTPAVVQSFDTVAGTITCCLPPAPGEPLSTGAPANATKSQTAAAGVLHKGEANYTPTVTDTGTAAQFSCETAIHWDAPGTMIQKVPNAAANNPVVQIDPDVLGGAE